MRSVVLATTLAVGLCAGAAQANDDFGRFADFGSLRDAQLRAHARQLFGVVASIAASSRQSIGAAAAEADPTALVTPASSAPHRNWAPTPT